MLLSAKGYSFRPDVFNNPTDLSYRLPYAGYFGGVSGLSKKQFLKINGFPNEYWGWGGEDDDIYNRWVWTRTVKNSIFYA